MRTIDTDKLLKSEVKWRELKSFYDIPMDVVHSDLSYPIEIKTKDGNIKLSIVITSKPDNDKHFADYVSTLSKEGETERDIIDFKDVKYWRPIVFVDEIIEYLQGTCKALYESLDYYGLEETDLNDAENSMIDDEIFNCTECGWWYELSEMGEDEEDECENKCINCTEY